MKNTYHDIWGCNSLNDFKLKCPTTNPRLLSLFMSSIRDPQSSRSKSHDLLNDPIRTCCLEVPKLTAPKKNLRRLLTILIDVP